MNFAKACMKALETKSDYTNGKMVVEGNESTKNKFYIEDNYVRGISVITIAKSCQGEFHKVVDWSKVEVDTKVWVRNNDYGTWEKGYFKEYFKNVAHCYRVFNDGKTSWTAEVRPHNFGCYKYCKLAEEGK